MLPLRSRSFGMGWEALLFNGVLGAAGLVMVVPLFVPFRWRRNGQPRRRPDRLLADAARSGQARRPGQAGRSDAASRPAGVGGGALGPGGGSRDTRTRDAFEPARAGSSGRLPTGPLDTRAGPIQTTSPIRTTGPIRIRPPEEHH